MRIIEEIKVVECSLMPEGTYAMGYQILKQKPMIKASELRIGNWIVFDGKILRATSNIIHSLDEEWFQAEPIPLTYEILEKCGFECLCSKWKNGHIELLVNLNGYDFFYGGFTKLEYLHQLQNLYFALTTEELEVNL